MNRMDRERRDNIDKARAAADAIFETRNAVPEPRIECGELGRALRTPLLDRVNGQIMSARNEAFKAGRLEELRELLLRNPEVARILDLIEEVRM